MTKRDFFNRDFYANNVCCCKLIVIYSQLNVFTVGIACVGLGTILLLAYLYCHENTLPPIQSGQGVRGSNNGPLIQPHSQEGRPFGKGAPSRGGVVLKALVHTHH